MTIVVRLASGETDRFVDDLHATDRDGGNRTYYEWVQHSYRVRKDESLSITRRTQESWYHLTGEHRDMHIVEENQVAVYAPAQWTGVRDA
jgi:hypothetical protein